MKDKPKNDWNKNSTNPWSKHVKSFWNTINQFIPFPNNSCKIVKQYYEKIIIIFQDNLYTTEKRKENLVSHNTIAIKDEGFNRIYKFIRVFEWLCRGSASDKSWSRIFHSWKLMIIPSNSRFEGSIKWVWWNELKIQILVKGLFGIENQICCRRNCCYSTATATAAAAQHSLSLSSVSLSCSYLVAYSVLILVALDLRLSFILF